MSLATQVSSLATAMGTQIKSLRVMITGSSSGTLASLQTVDKTSIIGAINEARTTGGSAASAASETVAGVAEVATQVEVTTGTDDQRMVTPLKLQTRLAAGFQPLDSDLTAIAGLSTTTYGRGLLTTADAAALKAAVSPDATTTATGFVELATLAEVATGTDTARAVTPAGVRQERTALKAEILGAAGAAYDTLEELKTYVDALDTTDEGQIQGVITALASRVRTDTAAQGLDATQQANARTNIDVYSKGEIGNPETDLVAVFNAALV